MQCHFQAQSENNSDFNFYPISPEHKGKSVPTTEELFSTLLKRDVLKLKTMKKSTHKIIRFTSNSCRPHNWNNVSKVKNEKC